MSRLASILVLVLLAAACGGGGAASESFAALNGEWLLTSGTGPGGEVDLSRSVEVTLVIDGERWGGTVCNTYGAESVDVGDGTVTIEGVYQTEMACLEEGTMEAEATYLAAFAEVTAYEVTSEELRLTGEEVELVYAPVATEPPPDLVGTVWRLDALVQGAGPEGTASSTYGDAEATLELREDGTLVASSGCVERDDGRYELDGSRLVIEFTADLDHDCPDEHASAQDRHVWQVLDGDPQVATDGQRLTLTSGELGLGYLPAN